MMLTKRDIAIIKDLNKFKVMDRDSIAELHFSGLKCAERSANNVLLRLMRDGQIQRSTMYVPYVYFGANTQIKKNSQKIGHWLAILNVYKEMRTLGSLETFLVEPKYGKKGAAEPDIFAMFRKTHFFIEVQNSVYSEKQMNEKLDRYVDLYDSGIMARPFPHVIILSDHRYNLEKDYPFNVFQASSFREFHYSLKPVEKSSIKNNISTQRQSILIRSDNLKLV